MMEASVSQRPFAGETASGDLAVTRGLRGGMLFAVIDGLGHGVEAEAAARRAEQVLLDAESGDLAGLMQACHARLQGTRGAVMSIAYFEPARETLHWLGIGNVEGVLFHRDPRPAAREYLLRQAGVVGGHLPRLHVAESVARPGDLLLLATDGIQAGFVDAVAIDQPVARMSARILDRYGDGRDDALILAVRLGNEQEIEND